MYTIKKLAQKVALPVSTIRYYERVGLLVPQRGENHYRYFTEADVLKIKYIKVMKYIGFTIEEIKRLLQLDETPLEAACIAEMDGLLGHKEKAIHEKIKQLTLVLDLMTSMKPQLMATNDEQQRPKINQKIATIYTEISQKGE
ncbi:MerR family transcriptional regulator [Isobaculum melis]|uniref:DNA-binding transcriptional regulator, MerR family n=1 Tax=Isobaculum melis TaxID=142588 RepID=A0A1H9STH1_9LACT|nr:MerR family transcriptional regulator [Isobaculum melis]SER88167.1 DNA-binding transcriptional regulator, MerR family [Isobaculum melis]